MKKFVLSSAAALLLATGAAQADSTHSDNWYASILGGATFDPASMAGGSLHDMDTGYNVGARVGYGLDNVPAHAGLVGRSGHVLEFVRLQARRVASGVHPASWAI